MRKHIGLDDGADGREFWRAHQLDPWHVGIWLYQRNWHLRQPKGVPANIDVMGGRSARGTGIVKLPVREVGASSSVHVEHLLVVSEHEVSVGPVSSAKIPVTCDGMEVPIKDVALDQRVASEPHDYSVPQEWRTQEVVMKVIVVDPYGLRVDGIMDPR